MNRERTKIRLLYLSEILNEHSDMKHPMSSRELLDMLEQYGVEAERKSIYRDIDALRASGVPVALADAPIGYYIRSRLFAFDELQTIVFALYSCDEISEKTCDALTEKIGMLTSTHLRSVLFKSLHKRSRGDEKLIDMVVLIDRTIYEGKKLSLMCRGDTTPRVLTPTAVVFDAEFILLSDCEAIRVSDIVSVEPLNELASFGHEPHNEAKKYFTTADEVTIEFEESLSAEVTARFPESKPYSFGAAARADVRPTIGSGFYEWIFSLSGQIKIISPESEVAKFREMLLSCLE